MIKKIFFQSIFFNFFFLKEVFSAESGGMPQLNPEFWISQIFWLSLTFGILYIVLSKLILPKISANLELRKSQIQENIEAAEKQRQSSEAKLKEYEEIIVKSKIEAKNIFKDAREKALKNINSKRETLDQQIDEEIKKAENEIDVQKNEFLREIGLEKRSRRENRAVQCGISLRFVLASKQKEQHKKQKKKAEKEIDVLKKNAPEKINKIAIETSSEILKKLIGADVNNSSISAIVDDLSKRSGNKYYGN